MILLSRYLGKTILNTMLLVLLVLVSIELLITFIGELNDIGTGDYNVLQAIEYVLLDMPRHVYVLFPMIALIGVLMGLGLLASNSELIIMRTSGVSVGQIGMAVVKVAIVIVMMITLVGETAGPMMKHVAESRKSIALSGGNALKTAQGVWLRDDLSFIRIDSILPGERLEGVTRYVFNNDHKLTSVTYAKSAFYQAGDWILRDVQQSKIFDKAVQSQHLPETKLKISLNPHLLRISQIEPEQMTLLQLDSYIQYRKQNGLRASNYDLAFWQRLFQPVATGLMIFLAIPFIFGPLRSATMGLRFIAGIAVGFSFYILNQFFGMSMVNQFPPVMAAVIPIILVSIVAMTLLYRTQ